jgi:hypothetical protein
MIRSAASTSASSGHSHPGAASTRFSAASNARSISFSLGGGVADNPNRARMTAASGSSTARNDSPRTTIQDITSPPTRVAAVSR